MASIATTSVTNTGTPISGAATNDSATAPADIFAAILDSMAQNFVAGDGAAVPSDVAPANDVVLPSDPKAVPLANAANTAIMPPALLDGATRLQFAMLDTEATDGETPDSDDPETAADVTVPVGEFSTSAKGKSKVEAEAETPNACAVPPVQMPDVQPVAPTPPAAIVPVEQLMQPADANRADTTVSDSTIADSSVAPLSPASSVVFTPVAPITPPVSAKPTDTSSPSAPSAPVQAPSAPDAMAAAAGPSAAPASQPADTTVPAQPAPAATSVMETDQAAASIEVAGTIEKPAKTEPAPMRDGEKSQGRRSSATSLADAGTSATRNFAPHQVSATVAVTPSPDNNPPNDSAQTPNQGAAAPSAPAVATSDAPPPPAQPVAAPQPDITAVAPTAVVQPAQAPAHIAAQLHVLQGSAHDAAPDVNSLAVNIATKAEGGARHFDIRLDPPELGRVDVRLTVDDAGRAQASLIVEKPHALELLQKDSTHLERALKDAGLDLTQNGLNFSLKGQQQNADGRAPLPRGRNLAARAIAAAETASTLPHAGVSASDTRLDIRV